MGRTPRAVLAGSETAVPKEPEAYETLRQIKVANAIAVKAWAAAMIGLTQLIVTALPRCASNSSRCRRWPSSITAPLCARMRVTTIATAVGAHYAPSPALAAARPGVLDGPRFFGRPATANSAGLQALT